MSMTPAGIEPATFRFVAQHLNHRATAIPVLLHSSVYLIMRTASPVINLFLSGCESRCFSPEKRTQIVCVCLRTKCLLEYVKACLCGMQEHVDVENCTGSSIEDCVISCGNITFVNENTNQTRQCCLLHLPAKTLAH